jgi:PhoH-like ATPase
MMVSAKRFFVIDTNVLMHDPSCIFRFQEHDVFIPMIVLEELDRGKKGSSEVARNVRQASRFLDDLMRDKTKEQIDAGLELPAWNLEETDEDQPRQYGRLFFQTENMPHALPDSLPGYTPDNDILGTAMALRQKYPERPVTLVSKDINLRIKAAIIGLNAEDYSSDQVLEDVNLLYKGHQQLPADFWDSHSKSIESWLEAGRSFYRIDGPDIKQWHVNQCLYIDDESNFEAMVREKNTDSAVIEVTNDYRPVKHAVWGINALNREQNFALNMLMDPDLDFVSLLGIAGTGKTLLTLAAGLAQVLDQNRYNEIIMTRVTVPVGEDIGFLPGTEEEKMTPWMGALMDNLEILTHTEGAGDWGRAATDDLLRSRIRIHSINFMRGRTFLNKYVIIDEAQNLTAKQMKTLITRAGPGTKIVCLGNVSQIDTPYLTETTSGLTYVVDKFKNWAHAGHITLIRGERSRLAEFASENL